MASSPDDVSLRWSIREMEALRLRDLLFDVCYRNHSE